MNDNKRNKIKLTVKEILLSLYDGIDEIEVIFGYPHQRREALCRLRSRELDKDELYHSLWRLERQGYIKRYKKLKVNSIKLTKIGKEKVLKYIFEGHKIKNPKKWDRKWRMIIFDIPEEKKYLRDILRNKLKYWGFFQLQKSVFVYPFDCQKEISALKYLYNLSPYMQFVIAENIESEIDLVKYYYDCNLLKARNE